MSFIEPAAVLEKILKTKKSFHIEDNEDSLQVVSCKNSSDSPRAKLLFAIPFFSSFIEAREEQPPIEEKRVHAAKYRWPCACQTADRSSRCQGQAQTSTVLADGWKSSTWFARTCAMAACVKLARPGRFRDRCADETGEVNVRCETLTFSIMGLCTLETACVRA